MFRIVCTFALFGLVLASCPARAALFTVNSTSDVLDVAPGDGVCDADPSAQVACTLRAAVGEANALGGADEISLPAGLYPLTLTGLNPHSDSALSIESEISITGAGAGVTTIDQTMGDRVIQVDFGGSTLTLTDVTVSGGDVSAFPAIFSPFGPLNLGIGGGIRIEQNCTATLVGVHITGNTARLGAGIYNLGTLVIAESVIDGNQASEGVAGIASPSSAGPISGVPNLIIVRSTIGPNFGPADQPSEIELGVALQNPTLAVGTVLDSTIAPPASNLTAVQIVNEQVELGHVTLRGGLRSVFLSGAYQLRISNSVVERCARSGVDVFERLGVNASSDASCGFAAAGGIEGPLGLGTLADNGGLSPTYLPQPGSALIDSAATSECRTTDQRGIDRPQGAACDIGAVEVVVPEPGASGAALATIATLAWLRRRVQ